MSTTSRSPGSAPWISMGPLSMWARVRSTSRTSLAESLLPSWASVHSRHSTRNSLPGWTDAAGGMSGCQRLWPGTALSRMYLDWSTLKTTSGMSSTFLAGCGVGMPWRAWRVRSQRRRGRRGAGTSARPAHGHTGGSRAVGELLARGKGPHTRWTLLRSRSERGVGELILGSYRVLTGEPLGARGPATGRSTRRLGGALWSGKACVGRIRRRGRWPPAQGHPVDHLRVVPACLLTGQHPGKGLGRLIGHRHREDPLGVPTTRRARRRRRGRAHSHPLLETAAVVAAILVGGHAILQGRQRLEASGPEACSMPTHPHRQERTGGSYQHRHHVASHILPSRLGEDR